MKIYKNWSVILLILFALSLFLSFAASADTASKPEKKEFTITAYCACSKCCGQWSGGPTASGVYPKEGVTVAASRSIPFGTKIHIDGVGHRVVQDRLAKRYDSRIDVYFASHKDALKFGKQKRVVQFN